MILNYYYTQLVVEKRPLPTKTSKEGILQAILVYNSARNTWSTELPQLDVNSKAAVCGKTLGDIVFTTWQTSWAKRINDFVGKADHKVPEVPSGKFLEMLSIQRGKQKIRNTWEMFLSWHVAAAMKQITQITRKKRSRPTAATNIEPRRKIR